MRNLIEIKEINGKKLISARELHTFLESKQEFTHWIKNRIEQYGFIENEDFTIDKFIIRKTWKHDYIITMDMAKELSMVERNEKGKEARKYFIECEKQLREIKLDSYMIEDPIKRAEKWLEEQRERQVLLQNIVAQKGIIEEYKPKVDVYNRVLDSKGLIKISTIAQDYGMSAIELNKLLHKLGIQYKKGDQWFLYAKYKDMGYTKSDYTEIPHRDGTISTKATTKWTPKGRLFIDEILKGIGISSVFINKSYQQIAF